MKSRFYVFFLCYKKYERRVKNTISNADLNSHQYIQTRFPGICSGGFYRNRISRNISSLNQQTVQHGMCKFRASVFLYCHLSNQRVLSKIKERHLSSWNSFFPSRDIKTIPHRLLCVTTVTLLRQFYARRCTLGSILQLQYCDVQYNNCGIKILLDILTIL